MIYGVIIEAPYRGYAVKESVNTEFFDADSASDFSKGKILCANTLKVCITAHVSVRYHHTSSGLELMSSLIDISN